MTSRVALGVSVLALAVAVLALVVAIRDTVETASSAVSDVSELVESLETVSVDPLAASEGVTVLTAPLTGQEAAGAAEASEVELLPNDASLSFEASDLESSQAAAPDAELVNQAAPVTTSLPGEPYEFGPAGGASLAVVGVDHDDVLNVRDVPAGEIIATLDLLPPIVGVLDVRDARTGEVIASLHGWEGGIVATGMTRKLPASIWHEVHVAGMTGWASGAYLAQVGLTDDVTSQVVAALGEIPVADTMLDLGLMVGQLMASQEPPSRVVVSVAPNVFEALGEMTVDVVNIGDDSVLGFRLDIFAHSAEDWMQGDPGPFTLKSVEQTLMCYSHRGVSEEGLCN